MRERVQKIIKENEDFADYVRAVKIIYNDCLEVHMWNDKDRPTIFRAALKLWEISKLRELDNLKSRVETINERMMDR